MQFCWWNWMATFSVISCMASHLQFTSKAWWNIDRCLFHQPLAHNPNASAVILLSNSVSPIKLCPTLPVTELEITLIFPLYTLHHMPVSSSISEKAAHKMMVKLIPARCTLMCRRTLVENHCSNFSYSSLSFAFWLQIFTSRFFKVFWMIDVKNWRLHYLFIT